MIKVYTDHNGQAAKHRFSGSLKPLLSSYWVSLFPLFTRGCRVFFHLIYQTKARCEVNPLLMLRASYYLVRELSPDLLKIGAEGETPQAFLFLVNKRSALPPLILARYPFTPKEESKTKRVDNCKYSISA